MTPRGVVALLWLFGTTFLFGPFLVGAAFLIGAAPLYAQPEASGPSELIDAPGRDAVIALCSECHEPGPKIAKLRKSRTEWSDLITDMENRGLTAEPADLEIVLNYLTDNYGTRSDNHDAR